MFLPPLHQFLIHHLMDSHPNKVRLLFQWWKNQCWAIIINWLLFEQVLVHGPNFDFSSWNPKEWFRHCNLGQICQNSAAQIWNSAYSAPVLWYILYSRHYKKGVKTIIEKQQEQQSEFWLLLTLPALHFKFHVKWNAVWGHCLWKCKSKYT